jgi:proteasome accessory factor A
VRDVLLLWDDALTKLERGRLADLAGALDWVLKLHLLEDTLGRRKANDWRSVEAAYLDYTYGDLDPSEGLFAAYDAAGAITRLVRDSEIEAFVHEPPDDTRAWTRAMLLRVLGDRVVHVDWDAVAYEHPDTGAREVVRLDDPRRFTRREHEAAGRAQARPAAARAPAPAPAPQRSTEGERSCSRADAVSEPRSH